MLLGVSGRNSILEMHWWMKAWWTRFARWTVGSSPSGFYESLGGFHYHETISLEALEKKHWGVFWWNFGLRKKRNPHFAKQDGRSSSEKLSKRLNSQKSQEKLVKGFPGKHPDQNAGSGGPAAGCQGEASSQRLKGVAWNWNWVKKRPQIHRDRGSWKYGLA